MGYCTQADFKHSINLEMGDISGDGHKISQIVSIISNYPPDELKTLYIKGAERLGFDPINDCCVEYEDRKIQGDLAQKLYDCGFKEDYNSRTKTFDFWTDSWAKLYLFTCQLGDAYFEYRMTPKANTIDIGGYGLYE